jgi:hypothetical protein
MGHARVNEKRKETSLKPPLFTSCRCNARRNIVISLRDPIVIQLSKRVAQYGKITRNIVDWNKLEKSEIENGRENRGMPISASEPSRHHSYWVI